LENGDRLDAEEFHRRYLAMPPGTRAQLIEGVVYLMPSPVRHTIHGKPNSAICGFFWVYTSNTPGVDDGTNSTTRLDLNNEPQPDALLRFVKGQTTIGEDGYIVGAPELVAEIAGSSVSIDLHQKFIAYQRNNVLEYIVWRVEDAALDWFVLENQKYVRLEPDANGVIKSRHFAGLWLNVPAMIAMDGKAVLKTLNEGIASAEHAELLKRIE
jgi:Putative restriction endonuclease